MFSINNRIIDNTLHFVNIFYKFLILAPMSHNVPAVYGVFASPIKGTVGFQGLQKCGWSGAWEA
jgi:hypothetical protein